MCDCKYRCRDDKALHHTISTAAALANWHAALSGTSNTMRPGIAPPLARPDRSRICLTISCCQMSISAGASAIIRTLAAKRCVGQ
jgi:hypothetical protein